MSWNYKAAMPSVNFFRVGREPDLIGRDVTMISCRSCQLFVSFEKTICLICFPAKMRIFVTKS